MLFPNGSTLRPRVSSPFGPRPGVGAFPFHYGADCIGYTTVRAAGRGRVTFAGWMNGKAGNTVMIDLGGGVTEVHMHLADFDTAKGHFVEPSSPLGRMGKTGNADGNCDHFEIRVHGKSVDPLDYVAARITIPQPSGESTAAPTLTEIGEEMFIADVPNGSFLVVPQGNDKPRAVVLDGNSGAATSGIPRLKFETAGSMAMLTAAVRF